MKLGIVGLPNVGKSTLFNAITSTKNAEAANYPFCTIEPNSGIVAVPDKRLDKLAEIWQTNKKTPAIVEFVDIAGLVKGASQGAGLGNKFLGHIRECDAIVHVVRCFDDDNIIHVVEDVTKAEAVDPIADIDAIDYELILSDLEVVQNRVGRMAKAAKSGNNKGAAAEAAWLQKLADHLSAGKPARSFDFDEGDAEQQAVLSFAKQIDLENAQQILEYGASAQKNIADFSDTALAKVKTGDLGEIGTMLSGLLVELKTLEEPEKKGIAGLFRKAKINAEEMKSRFATAEVNVDRISGELEKHKITLLKDVAVMDQMYERNLQYFKELTMYILAGKQKLAEARSTTLHELRAKAKASNLPEDAQKVLDGLHGGSNASYAIRFAASFPGIRMVLSGMGSTEMMADNCGFMKDFQPLNGEERMAIARVCAIFRGQGLIPCTGCRYCTEVCPQGIPIPDLFACMNTKKQFHDWNSDYYYQDVRTKNAAKASDCLKCGQCEDICPQHLNIRDLLEDVAKVFEK